MNEAPLARYQYSVHFILLDLRSLIHDSGSGSSFVSTFSNAHNSVTFQLRNMYDTSKESLDQGQHVSH